MAGKPAENPTQTPSAAPGATQPQPQAGDAVRAALDDTSPFTIGQAQDGQPIQVAGVGSKVVGPIVKHLVDRALPIKRGEDILSLERFNRTAERAKTDLRASREGIGINLDRIETTDGALDLIAEVSRHITPMMEEQGLLKSKTLAQVKADAIDLGITSQELGQFRPGEAWTAEKITAARLVLADSMQVIDDLASKIEIGQATKDEQAQFQVLLSKTAGVYATVRGATREAARALSAHRITAVPGELRMREIDAVLRSSGSAEDIARMWKSFDMEGGGGDAAKLAYARATQQPGFLSMIREAYINSLLSALTTPMVNGISNTLVNGWMIGERLIAGGIGGARRMLGGEGGVRVGEARAEVYGQVGALKDAWKLFAYTMRHEDVISEQLGYQAKELDALGGVRPEFEGKIAGGEDVSGKLDLAPKRAITGENVMREGGELLNKIARRDVVDPQALQSVGGFGMFFDVLGQFVRLPGRTLSASDQVFKTLAYRGVLRAEAYREAIDLGLTDPREVAAHIENRMAAPLEETKLKAMDAAEYRTFTNDLEGKISKGVQNTMQGGGWVVMPFVRTPINILSFTTERMMGPFRPKVFNELKSPDPVVRDMAMAKVATGAAVWGGVIAAASEGYQCTPETPICLTGAKPANPDLASTWRRQNQEYSVGLLQEDGSREWISYSRLDPIGQMLGIAADTITIMRNQGDRENDELGVALTSAIANNVINKTYLQGIADFMEAFTSYDADAMKKYLRRQAGSAIVPSFIASIERTVDPASSRIDPNAGFLDSVMEQAKARTPWFNDDLPPWRNVWGEPQLNDTVLHANWISPIYRHDAKYDPVDEELFRLGVPLNMPQMRFQGATLTPKEHDRWIVLAGNQYHMGPDDVFTVIAGEYDDEIPLDGLGFHQAMRALVTNPIYKKASDSVDPPGEKMLMIRKLQRLYRDRAGWKMVSEFPRLKANLEAAATQRALAGGMDPLDAEDMGRAERERIDNLVDFSLESQGSGLAPE